MDPNACLKRIDEAITDGDLEEADCAAMDLRNWLRRRGFPPAGMTGASAFDLACAVSRAIKEHDGDRNAVLDAWNRIKRTGGILGDPYPSMVHSSVHDDGKPCESLIGLLVTVVNKEVVGFEGETWNARVVGYEDLGDIVVRSIPDKNVSFASCVVRNLRWSDVVVTTPTINPKIPELLTDADAEPEADVPGPRM